MICGAVQGVGFRPFIYRLAVSLGLQGWVSNSSQGVLIEVEGTRSVLEEFLLRIEKEKPQPAFIQSLEPSFLDLAGYKDFEIRSSLHGDKSVLILPDIAVCPACLEELIDPKNRRYLYPFINCTHCGPRYSIMEALPYDRANTTMRKFSMCPDCQREYEDPADRRFHAQPNACQVCGPQVELWDEEGDILADRQKAMEGAATAIREGRIVAVKGLGGFHLLVDASDETAVKRLRERKHREEKPLALMYPSLESIRRDCLVSALEERLLSSPESPIVLLRKSQDCQLAASVAPANPYLGVMLPYTPLHFLLLRAVGLPVVATSGNLSEEPMCIDDKDALVRLKGIADLFLVHDRPIARQVDDSIVRIMAGREAVMRRARGYAPLPVTLKETLGPMLAVGAHLKNAIAVAKDKDVFLSQHIGDLENEQSFQAFKKTISDLENFYEIKPNIIACDMHPRYLSSQFANDSGIPTVLVQHHHAHILSCMAENEVKGPGLGVSWDGTGYGLDGTIWGGEFLKVDDAGFRRVAHFQTFPLPGGEVAVREPRRSAIGLLYRHFGADIFSQRDLLPLKDFSGSDLDNLTIMLEKNIFCPQTSSIGRIFDAVASLVGVGQVSRFEGQAAMGLEFAIDESCNEAYGFTVQSDKGSKVDIIMGPSVDEILADIGQSISTGVISAKFHNALVEIIITVARKSGLSAVVLSGGCFQNKYLTERAVRRLGEEGFRAYWHQRVPPNDGGIALGQIMAAQYHSRNIS